MTHEELVTRLRKPGLAIAESLTAAQADMLHMMFGIVGEAGELVDAIKKHCIYCQPLDLKNIIEELGDLEFYLEGLRQILRIERDKTLVNNIAKLQKRYDKLHYTDEDAKERKDKK